MTVQTLHFFICNIQAGAAHADVIRFPNEHNLLSGGGGSSASSADDDYTFFWLWNWQTTHADISTRTYVIGDETRQLHGFVEAVYRRAPLQHRTCQQKRNILVLQLTGALPRLGQPEIRRQ